jgi:hypothetical protein
MVVDLVRRVLVITHGYGHREIVHKTMHVSFSDIIIVQEQTNKNSCVNPTQGTGENGFVR